ncbi:MAG: hypothetical protein LKG36_05680 [[Lactobacillus] timonensis]|jgi:hypothetical protein|nr:hypothetical protein [[Lactobacillus] timonensis]
MRIVNAQILVDKGETTYQGKKEISFRGIHELIPLLDSQNRFVRYRIKPLKDVFFNLFEDNDAYPAAQIFLKECNLEKRFSKIYVRLKVDDNNNVISFNQKSLADDMKHMTRENEELEVDDIPTVEELYGPDLDNYPG